MRKTITKSAYKTSVIKTIKLLFFLSIILLCILLGLWQIDRGIQKEQLYEEFKERIPVVRINGEESFVYKTHEITLRRKLDRFQKGCVDGET